MPKLFIIFGPTGSGKGKLAQKLWERYHYPLISVDSRKIYKEADIGTNKLSIQEFVKTHPDALVGGINLFEPTEPVSVYTYQQKIYAWITEHEKEIAQARGLILFGGTGLYLDALVTGMTLLSPKNDGLRQALSEKTVKELQQFAAEKNPVQFSHLNESDRQNKRRLVRVIENAYGSRSEYNVSTVPSILREATPIWQLFVPERSVLYGNIDARVKRFFEEGWLSETVTLTKKYGFDAPILHMMGYKQIVSFLVKNQNWQELVRAENVSYTDLIADIQQEHRRLAKRQLTWGRKYLL